MLSPNAKCGGDGAKSKSKDETTKENSGKELDAWNEACFLCVNRSVAQLQQIKSVFVALEGARLCVF